MLVINQEMPKNVIYLQSNKTKQVHFFIFLQLNIRIQTKMDPQSPLISPTRRKKHLMKKLQKLLKQQQHHDGQKNYQPGKVQIHGTKRCKIKVVNFFGDVHTEVYSLHVSPNQQFVAVGCSNGDVKVYQIYEGKLSLMGNTSRLSGFPNTGIRWNPKSNIQFTSCNCDGTIKWYNCKDEVAIAHHQSQVGYLCADYNSDGTWSVYGNQKHEIEVFDQKTKKLLQKYQAGSLDSLNPNHTNRVFCVKGLKTDPNLLFSGGWDASVRLWDVRVGESCVRKFGGPMVSADSLDLKNNVLLAGNYSTQDIVQFWDFTTGKLIKTFDIKEPSTSTAYCFTAAYAHNSKYNLSAAGFSGIDKVKVFQGDQFIGEVKFQASPLCLNFYKFNDKDFMIASGYQGTVYALKIKIIQN